MKKIIIFILLWLSIGGLICCFISPHPQLIAVTAESKPAISVHFSPNGKCTDVIVDRIKQAKVSIKVEAYCLTSKPIIAALAEASKTIPVQILVDNSQVKNDYGALKIKFVKKYAIFHNKVMLIDGNCVITGSFNFTKAAEEKNAENLLVIFDEKLYNSYLQEFERIWIETE